jgi:CRP-like cAMP-binding protein
MLNDAHRRILEKSKLFRHISIDSIEDVLAECPVYQLAAGDILIEPEQDNHAVYIVLDGGLSVQLVGRDAFEVSSLGPGECVGEISMVDGQRPSARVRASEPTSVLVLGHPALWTLLNRSHGVAFNLLWILSGRMRDHNKALEKTRTRSLEFEHAASVDVLTGLHNRRWLDDSFARMLRRCANDGRPASLLMIDIDRFKHLQRHLGTPGRRRRAAPRLASDGRAPAPDRPDGALRRRGVLGAAARRHSETRRWHRRTSAQRRRVVLADPRRERRDRAASQSPSGWPPRTPRSRSKRSSAAPTRPSTAPRKTAATASSRRLKRSGRPFRYHCAFRESPIRSMIRKLFRRVFSKAPAPHEPALIPVEQHHVRRESISPGARQTVVRLQEHGHAAYVVGGAVRDLLAGIVPKDFDIATDATPEQVRGLFRRSRIIGRRFRIVHVMQGGETIEVSTFRAGNGADAETDAHGRVLRDNVFGNMEEDAARRDFTINALYYDPTPKPSPTSTTASPTCSRRPCG